MNENEKIDKKSTLKLYKTWSSKRTRKNKVLCSPVFDFFFNFDQWLQSDEVMLKFIVNATIKKTVIIKTLWWFFFPFGRTTKWTDDTHARHEKSKQPKQQTEKSIQEYKW